MTPQFFTDENNRMMVMAIDGCGTVDTFTRLEPNTSEGAAEKHLPVVERTGDSLTVKVGSVYHPMGVEHSIGWIYLETEKGGQLRCMSSEGEPVAEFRIAPDDTPVAVYAYCNLHGLWKTVL